MDKFSVSSFGWGSLENSYVGVTDERNAVVCLVSPLAAEMDRNDLERAERIRLALELIDEIPTDLLREIHEQQFDAEQRAEILRCLRVTWYSSQRINRLPLRHIQPAENESL
jgi:hypothetical protein